MNMKKLSWLHAESISTSFTAFFPGDIQEITPLCWRKQLSPISYLLAHHQPSSGEFTPEMPLSQKTNLFCTQPQKAWVSAQHVTLIPRSLVKTHRIKTSISINIFTLKNLGKSQELQPIGWIHRTSQAVPYGYPVSGNWPLSKSFTSHAHSYFKKVF